MRRQWRCLLLLLLLCASAAAAVAGKEGMEVIPEGGDVQLPPVAKTPKLLQR